MVGTMRNWVFKNTFILSVLYSCLFIFNDTFAGDEEKKEIAKNNVIPAIIAEDLTLRPTKVPYTTNGFKIPRGITLTIEPGVIIIPDGTKSDNVPLLVEGSLIIGKKGGANVVIEIPSIALFSGANIEMNQVEFTSNTITLNGGTEGSFTNCIFIHTLIKKTMDPFELNIPKRGVLTFSKCNFVNHPIRLPENIQETKDKIKFEYCAFTPRWDIKNSRYTSVNIDSNIFLVGTKCDLYTYIEWKKMSYDFNPIIKTDWYIKDASMKTSLASTLASAKGFSVEIGTPFTSFKPETPPKKELK
jgi:hypothetical protein